MYKIKMSPALIQQVITLFTSPERPTYSAIGQQIGYTPQAVKYQLLKAGLIIDEDAPIRGSVHAMTDEDIAEAVRLHEGGAKLAAIGGALGFSVETIRRRLMETGKYRTSGRGRPVGATGSSKVDVRSPTVDRDPGATNPMMREWASKPLFSRAA